MSAALRVLYFAWVREKTGTRMEEITLPTTVKTARDLAAFLAARSAGHAAAFADLARLKIAIDQRHAALGDSVVGAQEIAWFPPVTGG